MIKTIDIIIPVYNEENTLETVIKKIEETDFCNLEKKIILVDDKSTDKSKDILQKYPQHTIIFKDKNEGKGSAVWAGIKAGSGDIIIIQDADLEYNPQDYQIILPYIINEEESVVYGSRLKNNNIKSFMYLSYLANIFLTFLTNLLFRCNITDMETCYKAFRRDTINDITIKSKKFEFEVEITSKITKKGIHIKEVPIYYNSRTHKSGKKISWKDGIQAIFAIFYYKFFD